MTTSTPEVSTCSTPYFLVPYAVPCGIQVVTEKINEIAPKHYIDEEKSIPSSCSFSTALLTRGVISVESELFFSMLSQLWNIESRSWLRLLR